MYKCISQSSHRGRGGTLVIWWWACEMWHISPKEMLGSPNKVYLLYNVPEPWYCQDKTEFWCLVLDGKEKVLFNVIWENVQNGQHLSQASFCFPYSTFIIGSLVPVQLTLISSSLCSKILLLLVLSPISYLLPTDINQVSKEKKSHLINPLYCLNYWYFYLAKLFFFS